ncbi:uncharacterized protein DUF4365 [Alicyclobacillus sacchari]|uniref:Uncharacterized protein DUF4365 n=2 Tax=Alicyclobacillus sacchari TaxID=392010 RepID=A0A4R8LC02_9BACL|nr:DUF4365 domain-containing protein [Alicyclobacillus sacchari]TDY40482.1 uncharacterized protein DUF4365 [Alicyclobacillus sacchari]
MLDDALEELRDRFVRVASGNRSKGAWRDMDLNLCKEQFSFAYVNAVAAAAGFSTVRPSVDVESIDLTICSQDRTGRFRSPKLDVQLKSTAQDILYEEVIKFPLKRKNYDDLILKDILVPRILVVVVLPDAEQEWLSQSEDGLLLRRCGYWISLSGRPETDNQYSVMIEIPRRQVFSVESLTEIMRTIGREGKL